MNYATKWALLNFICRSQFLERATTRIAAHAVYRSLREAFISNCRSSGLSEAACAEIVARFEVIDRNVPIATTPVDGLVLAEILLNLKASGAIVECGCFAGGSSAKLSIIASHIGRKLIIFDSFEGLPVSDGFYLRDRHCRHGDDWVTDWTAGRYAKRLDEVAANIERFGEIASCSFVRGFFRDTLTAENLPQPIAFAFADVDLASSAKECFTSLFPLISDQGVYASHDAAYLKVLLELYRPELWRAWNSVPPILFGAGYGVCNESPHLGYMVKGEDLSPDYLKSLTINK